MDWEPGAVRGRVILRVVRAVIESSRRLPPRSAVTRDEQFGWCIASPDGELLAVDDHLRDLARFRLPEDSVGGHGIRSDLNVAAVSGRSRVVAIDRAGSEVWEVPHPAWGRGDSERGSCWFSADGVYVWAHVPTEDAPDEWLLIESGSGGVAGRVPLSCYSAGSGMIRHPDNNRVGLSVGEGQDGSETYFGHVEHGLPVVERLDDRSRILIAFSPDGVHFLSMPHSSGPIQLHRVADGGVVASLDPAAALDEDDEFDLFGGFASPDLVLFTTQERDSVFAARVPHLDAVETVSGPGRSAGNPIVVIDGGFVTAEWLSGETSIWRLSS